MSNIQEISEGMSVVALDGREIGTVGRVDISRFVIRSVKDGRGFDHLIPVSWIAEVGKYVFLNKGSRYVAANWDAPVPITQSRRKAA